LNAGKNLSSVSLHVLCTQQQEQSLQPEKRIGEPFLLSIKDFKL